MLNPFILLLVQIIDFFNFVLFIWLIVTILIQFGIVNKYHPIMSRIMYHLDGIFEPILNKVREFFPFLVVRGLDLSPIMIFFMLNFIRNSLYYYA